MVNRRGKSTKTAYIRSAGKTNNQPTRVSRWTRLLNKDHRETIKAARRLFDVIIIDVAVAQANAGIVLRQLRDY
jgi:hypothetical protein